MPRRTTPSRATQELIGQLRARGVEVTARRLEDWGRWGLVARPVRRSLGQGQGTVSEYPPNMVERCLVVAPLMRRGVPWQQVALTLFAGDVELPEETVRAAYRWAYESDIGSRGDELDAAEAAVEQMSHTRAGRRLERAIAHKIKRSGLFPDEDPVEIARSVLTLANLVRFGGPIAEPEAVIEMVAGFGVPVEELSEDDRDRAAEVLETFLSRCSCEEILELIDRVALSELSDALPECREALALAPADIVRLIPDPVAQMIVALLAPSLLHVQRVAAELGLSPVPVEEPAPRGEPAAHAAGAAPSPAPATMVSVQGALSGRRGGGRPGRSRGPRSVPDIPPTVSAELPKRRSS